MHTQGLLSGLKFGECILCLILYINLYLPYISPFLVIGLNYIPMCFQLLSKIKLKHFFSFWFLSPFCHHKKEGDKGKEKINRSIKKKKRKREQSMHIYIENPKGPRIQNIQQNIKT